MSKKEFCRRFEAELTKLAGGLGPHDIKRSHRAASSCWNDYRRDDGPEACATTYFHMED